MCPDDGVMFTSQASPFALDPATGSLVPVNANVVLFASVLSLVLVELVVSVRADRWNRRDSTTSVGVGLGYLALKVATAGSAAVAAYIWLYRNVGIFDWSWRSPLTWLAYWLIGDFAYYWIHRAEHRVAVLWASHQVHHSAESLTFVTAVRMPWTEVFYKPFTGLWAPLLGFPPIMYPVMGAFSLMIGQLQHTEMITRLGWLDRWFTTPSNHRVHHASNRQYLDKNFGGHTMIWDRLFGTYEPEVEAPRYGMTVPLTDQRVRRVVLGGYPQLIRSLRGAESLRQAGRVALAPPTH